MRQVRGGWRDDQAEVENAVIGGSWPTRADYWFLIRKKHHKRSGKRANVRASRGNPPSQTALPLAAWPRSRKQLTGKVDRIDKELIMALIERQVVPLVSPLAFGPDGKSLRVNSDLLAAEMAEALHATKIIYLAPNAGLEIEGEVRHEISAEALRSILKDHPEHLAESSRSKATYAIKAIESGTPRVHIVDGRVFDGLLNEIFSNEGVGSLVYGNDYQQIRKATRRDARLLYNLTRNAVRREELIHRTQQAIEKNIDQFFVFEVDEAVIACVTLMFYPDRPETAEIA